MTPPPLTLAARLGLVTRSAPVPEPVPVTAEQVNAAYAAAIRPPARTGTVATVEDVTTMEAVYRALTILETGAMQLSMDCWRTISGITQRIEPPGYVRNPDPTEPDAATFHAGTVVSLATRGNAYWRKHRDPSSQVIALELLDPLEVTPHRSPRGSAIIYTHKGEELTRWDIQHLKLLRMTGRMEGLGPIQATQASLAGALALREYSNTWFDSSHVDAILKSEQNITAEQAASLKKRWNDSQRMKDGPAVLGQGLTYEPLSLKPSEVQWLENQEFSVTQIARLFGIPSSYMLASIEGTSQTYKNQEQEDIAFVRFTLMRYLREIELAMSAILPRGTIARFNVDALLRTDTLTRYKSHEIGLRAGFLTVSEVRSIEGLDPTTTTQETTTND